MIEGVHIRSNYSCGAAAFKWSSPIHYHTCNYMLAPSIGALSTIEHHPATPHDRSPSTAPSLPILIEVSHLRPILIEIGNH
jgi:hypothetical protein